MSNNFTNIRFGAAVMAALGVLVLVDDFHNPKVYIQAAIAFAGTFWRLREKGK